MHRTSLFTTPRKKELAPKNLEDFIYYLFINHFGRELTLLTSPFLATPKHYIYMYICMIYAWLYLYDRIQAHECQHIQPFLHVTLFFLACSGLMPCSSCMWQDLQAHASYSGIVVCNIPTYYWRRASLALAREANHVWFQGWKNTFSGLQPLTSLRGKDKAPMPHGAVHGSDSQRCVDLVVLTGLPSGWS